MNGTIVIADDESNITDVCRRYLEREGYRVLVAQDGKEALQLWEAHAPDLLVLDLMMPLVDGWQVCETVRQRSDVPVILLTARGEEPDRLLGLTMGADDYMTKPFSPRELVLRVANILRRVGRAAPAASARSYAAGGGLRDEPATGAALAFEGLAIYPEERRVAVDGTDVELTVKEFDLLLTLAGSPGRVFSRSQLLSLIWDIGFEGDTTTVTVHIRRLREKMEQAPSEPRWIKTVWGIGYKFDAKGQP